MKPHLIVILKLLSELEPFGIRGVRHSFDEEDACSWSLDVERGVARIRICWDGFHDYDMMIRKSSYRGADGTWDPPEIIDRDKNHYIKDIVIARFLASE